MRQVHAGPASLTGNVVRRRPDAAAVSEIVGALMLVLIVTTAGSTFAIFTAKQRERTEAQQRIVQDRALENLQVLAVKPTASGDGSHWTSLNFTVLATQALESRIVGLSINDVGLSQYHLVRAAGTSTLETFGPAALIEPRERFNVNVSVADDGAAPLTVPVDAGIHLVVETERLNNFERTFLPPTAIALVDVKSQGGFNYAFLDASQSDEADASARIMKWEWTVEHPIRIDTVTGSADVVSAGAFLASDVLKVVTGPGIDVGTTIVSVTDKDHATLSAPATADATGVPATVSYFQAGPGRVFKAFECPSDTAGSTAGFTIRLRVSDNFGLFSTDEVLPSPYAC